MGVLDHTESLALALLIQLKVDAGDFAGEGKHLPDLAGLNVVGQLERNGDIGGMKEGADARWRRIRDCTAVLRSRVGAGTPDSDRTSRTSPTKAFAPVVPRAFRRHPFRRSIRDSDGRSEPRSRHPCLP